MRPSEERAEWCAQEITQCTIKRLDEQIDAARTALLLMCRTSADPAVRGQIFRVEALMSAKEALLKGPVE